MAKRQNVKGPTGRRVQKLKGYRVKRTGVRGSLASAPFGCAQDKRDEQGLGVRGTADAALPRIGESPEEIQAALMRGMHDLLAGRITVKEANRIAHAANMQLHRLRVMDWLARMAKRKEGPRSKCGSVQVSKSKSGTPRWVN